MFQILNLQTNEFVLEPQTYGFLRFESGQMAAQYAIELTEKTAIKHQPRKIVDQSSNWIQREQARVDSGFYTVPSWIEKYKDQITIPPNLFVHVSKLDSAKIAFTQTPEKGASDIQTQIRIGAFLLEYCQFTIESDVNKSALIQEIALDHATTYAPQEFKIATSADAIQRIYENGPNSCMSHPADEYDSFCHPVRVYGDSDLSLAYLFDDENNRATARALVWQEKKIFGRVYGDIERLTNALKTAGYENERSFNGARIRRIVCDVNDVLVLPYLDGIQTVCRDPVDPSNFLRISRDGDITANQTNGLQQAGIYCESCDSYETGDFRTVYVSRHNSVEWCEHCADRHAFYCEHTDDLVADRYATRVDGEIVAEWVAEDNAIYCEYSDEMTFEPCVSVIINDHGDEQMWRESLFGDHGFVCRIDGQKYANELAVYDDGIDEPRASVNEIEQEGNEQ